MGTLLDTTVFIEIERTASKQGWEKAFAAMSHALVDAVGTEEEVGIAAITASELLHGVHRATPEHRARREAFVETVLTALPAVPFDLLTARVHAQIWAQLASSGADIGAHDRLVAATAIAAGWRVGTANVRHFERVPGLATISVRL